MNTAKMYLHTSRGGFNKEYNLTDIYIQSTAIAFGALPENIIQEAYIVFQKLSEDVDRIQLTPGSGQLIYFDQEMQKWCCLPADESRTEFYKWSCIHTADMEHRYRIKAILTEYFRSDAI